MNSRKSNSNPNSSLSSSTSLDFDFDNDDVNAVNNTSSIVEMSSNSPDRNVGTRFKIDKGLENDDDDDLQYNHNDRPISSVSKSTYVFVMCAALNSCNLGYDIGVNTSAGKLLQDENSLALNQEQLELFMGSINLFAAIGAIFASRISDRHGRKGSFLVAAIGFIIGVSIQSLANSFVMLMIGRVLVGLGIGFGLAIDPIYIAEISPSEHRGRLVTWSEIGINIGIVFGFASGLVFYNVQPDVAWRLMFATGIILPSVLIFMVFKVMPESPRWLIAKGREEEAKVVLEKIYPIGRDIDDLVVEIRNAIEREIQAEQIVGWNMIFFPTPAVRRMLLVGVGSAIAQQLVGIDAIQYFLDYVLEEIGIEEGIKRIFILIGLGVLKLIVIFYAGLAFDKNGRRPLFFISLIGLAVSLFILAATFGLPQLNSSVGIFGLALYLCSFSVGMGPGAWLIPAEVFSTVIRAKAMSLSAFMNRTVATLLTSQFFTLANALTYTGFFILLGFINLGILAFFYVFLPETNGKTLEEMSVYFAELTGDASILEAERKLQQSLEQDGRENSSAEPIGTMT